MQPSTYAIKSHEALTGSLVKLGSFPEALRIADRALALGSADRVLRLRRAWIHAHLGQLREAFLESDRALAFDGAFPRPHDEHVRALCVLGRFEEALGALEEALARDPGDLAARCGRALILVGLGRRADARTDLGSIERRGDDLLATFAALGREALQA